MVIGERLRVLREAKSLSQGDIEERTGLNRCYVSRLENGHIVPAVETLEKIARALEVPTYQLFYDGEAPPKVIPFPKPQNGSLWGSSGKEAAYLLKLRRCLANMGQQDRAVLLHTLQKMVESKRREFE